MKDFEELSKTFQTPYTDLWNFELSLFCNTQNLVNKFVLLPDKEIQSTMVAVYLWLNSRWIKECPLILCKGSPGSGKSILGTLAAKLHQSPILPSTATFASLRNTIELIRFGEEKGEVELEGAFLVWDNVRASYFLGSGENATKRDLLLNGYKKGTDVVPIAQPGNGQVINFHTFCPKVLTSIDALWQPNDLRELKRRLMPVFHEVIPEDSDSAEGLLDIESVNFDKFYADLFWDTYAGLMWQRNAATFLEFRKACKAKRRMAPFDENRKSLCLDFFATGHLIGAWETPEQAYETVGEYWKLVDTKIGNDDSDIEQMIGHWVHTFYGDATLIPNSAVLAELERLSNRGDLVAKPKPKEIFDSFQKLGYRKERGDWVK